MGLLIYERIRLRQGGCRRAFGIRGDEEGDWLAHEGLGAAAAIRLTA